MEKAEKSKTLATLSGWEHQEEKGSHEKTTTSVSLLCFQEMLTPEALPAYKI